MENDSINFILSLYQKSKREREKINMEVKGYIHSFESFGTKDGP